LVEFSKFPIGGRIFSRAVQDYLAGGGIIAKSPNHQTKTKVELVIPILTLRGCTKERGEAG
jgi:hypothetical protein